VYWSAFDERDSMTINAHSVEYLDLFAIVDSGVWLCAKCYANRYYAPKKKFETKKERYKYLSELFSGDGNPMYGVHKFGRTYTAERNEKVSEAVTIWAASHPGHYKEMGIRGVLKAREKGLLGLPTNLEKAIEMDYTYIRG